MFTKEKDNKYTAIGVMSGTSLDGLDIALIEFYHHHDWSFNILKASTIEYPDSWKNKLSIAPNLSEESLNKLDFEYGVFIGEKVKSFLKSDKVDVDLIASHGHTVFHQPQLGFTKQIGDGNQIAEITGITTTFDFRSKDVSLGGQGAPLVPIGDKYLFGIYNYCINLGGFSNISFEKDDKRIAFDICPVNIVLNNLAKEYNMNYDKEGRLGSSGEAIPSLVNQFNAIDYYHKSPPKSLGKEWVDEFIYPIIKNSTYDTLDIIRSFYEHISDQITTILNNNKGESALFTGGGTHNTFLMNLIKSKTNKKIVVPDNIIIDFKEALIFAFMGVLRIQNQLNCLSSVTGAKKDCSGGQIVIKNSIRI